MGEFKDYKLWYDPARVGEANDQAGFDDAFINPYTFFPYEVRYSPSREKPERSYGDKSYTGKLTCSLSIETPLFIPNTSKVFTEKVEKDGEMQEHKLLDFFSYDDLSETQREDKWPDDREPVIPGSSLRGMARNVYEQLTNSCYSQISMDEILSKRTPFPKTPYRMEWDPNQRKWELREVELIRVGKWHHAENTYGVGGPYSEYVVDNNVVPHAHNDNPLFEKKYVVNDDDADVQRVRTDEEPNRIHYAYHPTGEMQDKHLILFPLSGAGTVRCSLSEDDDVLKRFECVVDMYCAEATEENHNKARSGYEVYRDRYRNKQKILVYADNKFKYLSPACMTREVFEKRIRALVGSHAPCTGAEGVFCPACRLFGMVGDAGSMGGRVRFSDAAPADKSYAFAPWTPLPALSSPKLGATEFYLKRPRNGRVEVDKSYWNYDYYTVEGGHGYHHSYDASINGRKVYLHHSAKFMGKDKTEFYGGETLNKSNQNVTVRPLTAGNFTFDVCFEDLSGTELANLAFAVGWVETGENGRLQKLGHGKPLGMGSVMASIDSVILRAYEEKDGKIKADTLKKEGKDRDEFLQELENKVLDNRLQLRGRSRRLIVDLSKKLDAEEDNLVRYPTGNSGPMEDGNLPFEWFGANRGVVNDPVYTQTLYVKPLPGIEE